MKLFNKISVFIQRKNRAFLKKLILKKEKEILKDTNFIIVADNCWGSAVYQWYERPYNSPFAGVGIYADCYLKLLTNFDYYMNLELIFVKESNYSFKEVNYPLALLGDVELHFTHYKTAKEAGTKWKRRTERMLEEINKDNYFFKMCDAWKADETHFEKFHKLPYKNKVSFIQKDKKRIDEFCHIGINERNREDKSLTPNGIKLFKISFLYFDVTKWLKDKKMVKIAR